jgi:hypothetical protein
MERRSAASGPGALARQKGVGKPIPVVEAPILVTGPETGGYGPLGRSVLVAIRDRLARPFALRAGEAARRVAVLRGDALGVELGADPAYRLMVNVGSVPAVPAEPSGLGQAHRPLLPPGRGGGPVVVVGVATHRGGGKAVHTAKGSSEYAA